MTDQPKNHRGFDRKDVTAWLLGKASPQKAELIEQDLERPDSIVADFLAWRAGHRPRQPSPVLVREYLDSLAPEFVRALNRMGEESEPQRDGGYPQIYRGDDEPGSAEQAKGEDKDPRHRIGPGGHNHIRIFRDEEPEGPSR